jgi:acyl carrier protein
MSESIAARVTNIIARQLGINDQAVLPEHHIFDDLGSDSLDAIELVMECEEVFEIDIRDADAEQVKTVQQAIDLVVKLV